MRSEEFERQAALLQAVGMAEAREETLDLEALAAELGSSVPAVREEIERLDRCGLIISGFDDGPEHPLLRLAGRQYLTLRGQVDDDVVSFLPHVIDDLHAREALLHAGAVLVDEFRFAFLQSPDDAVEYAQTLVPAAFVEAVDVGVALDLYAAAVALLVRLSDGRPAGCVGEEIIAVSLIEEAKLRLQLRAEEGDISEREAAAAEGELRGLFELFQDDDVLQMFAMSEPADAAVAGHSPLNRMAGVADQRIEAWFRPFGGTTSTGYLHEPKAEPDEPPSGDPI